MQKKYKSQAGRSHILGGNFGGNYSKTTSKNRHFQRQLKISSVVIVPPSLSFLTSDKIHYFPTDIQGFVGVTMGVTEHYKKSYPDASNEYKNQVC